MVWLDEQAVRDLQRGAAILGSGGGGDTYLGALVALQAVRKHGPARLLAPYELADQALVISVAFMGSPAVFDEKLPGEKTLLAALEALQEHLGRQAEALVPVEVGGRNCLSAVATAAAAGLPLVDADGFGRAFPDLQMVSFGIYGVQGCPFVLVNEPGDVIIIRAADNHTLEHLARGAAQGLGGVAHLAGYPMLGAQLKETAVLGTVSLALRIGQHMRRAAPRLDDILSAINEVTSNSTYGPMRLLCRGQVVELYRTAAETESGAIGAPRYAFGTAQIRCRHGRHLQVQFQNEFLQAESEGKVVVSVPDLITMLDTETLQPLHADTLACGQHVAVLGIPVPEIMQTPQALKCVGPRSFGYDIDYQPLDRPGRAGEGGDGSGVVRVGP